MGLESVTLRDTQDATAIRLRKDENAPALSVVRVDKLYPYRQKELVRRLSERLGSRPGASSHDLQCIRRAFQVDDDQTFSHQARSSPRKYSEAYVEWILQQVDADPAFFQQARNPARSRNTLVCRSVNIYLSFQLSFQF